MTTSNSINADSTGLVRYNGTGTFDAVTTTQHDLLVGAASNGITNVAPSATSGVPVISQGASADPTFGTAVVAGGGTGQVTLTNHGVLVGAGTAAITQLAAGSAGQVLQSGGASADPAYSTATFPSTATSTGTVLRADGTNWVATTATYPNTVTASNILYGSASNVVSGLATANNGTLVTSNTGVPSILAGPGTTGNILQSNAAAAPSFSTATYPSTATTTGQILRADGTNWVGTTATYPNTAGTSGNVLKSDGTNWSSSSASGSATTYSPAITFGGGSTGITYTTQLGKYYVIGSLVFLDIFILLSSKGSSTGTALISLPVTTANDAHFPVFATQYVNLTYATGTQVSCYANPNTTNLNIIAQGSVVNNALTNTAFANNTQLQITGFYWTA